MEQNFNRFIASTLQRLNDSPIAPDAHRAKPHIEICEADPEQAEPRPKHVPAVEAAHACVGAITTWRFGKLIEKAASQMTERMTTKSVAGEQDDIDREHKRAYPDPE